MAYNYRFSIIPPGAITDPRVTPRALQVLCLLGRHINDGGWCSRSQVKMARELDCSRSSVQEACDILLETGWIERRRNGRGGTGPESSEQPFAAYSYRVRIDRDDLPSDVVPDDVPPAPHPEPSPDAVETDKGGAGIAAGGAAQAAGGAAQAAPLEGISSEGIFSEPERDTRGRDHEEFAKWLSAFLLRWPTAAADDQSRIATAGRALEREQRKAALDSVPAFLDHLKKLKRKHIPAGWRYLEQRSWEQLPQAAAQAPPTLVLHPDGSMQCRLWELVFKIARPRAGVPSFKRSQQGGVYANTELPQAMLALCDDAMQWREYRDGEPNHAAWRRWLCELIPPNLIETMHDRSGNRMLRVPCPWPPRKDGTIAPESTGPPSTSAA